MVNIYVLSKDGKPLMPVHGYGRARRLIKSGKAYVYRRMPFIIRLTYDIVNPIVDECVLGIDPGRTNIGVCVTDSKGTPLFASDVETRNKEVPRLMAERRAHRHASRRGERLRRRRRAVAADKTGAAKLTEYWRILPGCKEPVRCKVIRNTQSRFNHRARSAKWFTPTAQHLLETHLNLVRKLQKLLPISCVVIEANRFDFQRMMNPGIRNWEYQKGRLWGYADKYAAVSERQEHKCLLCGGMIDHYHHVIPRHEGGSDTIDNLAGLCNDCHGKVHTNPAVKERLSVKFIGLKKKYHALSVLNQIMPKLLAELPKLAETYTTYGHKTRDTREAYGLTKDHYVDAWCIAVSVLDNPESPDFKNCLHSVLQFRRHDRARVKSQRERTYYLDGKVVAKNRRPRFEQNTPALSDLNLTPAEISRLTVRKSLRYYNTQDRLMPGAVFMRDGKFRVMSGQLSGGAYLRALGDASTNHPTREARVVARNTGIVMVS